MQTLIGLLMLPLILLNFLGGLVGGVWLAIIGDWGSIGMGLAGLFGGAFLCGLLLLPGFIFSVPAVYLAERNGPLAFLGYLVGLIGLLWTYLVMSGWGFFSFNFFLSKAGYENSIPYLLWAYSVATAPWAYMASKEPDGYASVSVFFLQPAAAFFVISVGFTGLGADTILIVGGVIMALGFFLNIFMGGVAALFEHRARKANLTTP